MQFFEKQFSTFEKQTKNITGVYGIIATIGCFGFAIGINPIVIAVLCAISAGAYQVAMQHYVVAGTDEWLLVMKDGEAIQQRIGGSRVLLPRERAYVFPSILRTVNFTANQVTNEMQGVEVSGALVWSIYNTDDGPLKCFKSFGEDITRLVSRDATSKIQAMAISILRNQIANMTIDEILKNR